MENNIIDKTVQGEKKNFPNGISISHASEKKLNTPDMDISQKNLKDIDESCIVDINRQDEKNFPNGILTKINYHLWENFQTMTELDLSKKNLDEIDLDIIFPPCLRNLNLSYNNLPKVPKVVLNLDDLEVLDVSHNKLQYFNESPSFCHVIKSLNLSSNDLRCPPVWVWLETPKNLSKLDISCNMHIAEILQEHVDELLQYNTQLTHVTLYNCKLGKHLRFLGTFPKAQELVLGTPDWSLYSANHLQEIPCQGLDKCYDIQRLISTNTHIYTITPEISVFKNLIEINLSHNNLNGLPTAFCKLENLEICILSYNNILYVPDEFVKLKKLTTLSLAVNELCMLPENIMELTDLKVLDLYDNHINEYPDEIRSIPELDLAQNYFEEPDDEDYLNKRRKLRTYNSDRLSGRKFEMEKPDSEYSPDTTDDEEFMKSISEKNTSEEEPRQLRPSSPEDWDSDSYWEPYSVEYKHPVGKAFFTAFVKQAMKNGNLCPSDDHVAPVHYKYKTQGYESDEQFDDYEDDS